MCRRCGEHMRPDARHAQLCAGAGETVGHNRIRDAVHVVAVAADPSACLEPAGLVPSRPLRRPADVLTYAAGSIRGCTALDVGVTTPWSSGASGDCAAAMRQGKLARARPWVAELAAEGVDYVPLAVSCFARWEDGAAAVIDTLAKRAARRAGLASAGGVRRRAKVRLAVEVWRRTVSCLRTCCLGSADEPALLCAEE